MLRTAAAEQCSSADRSIVRCSATQQILAICSTALRPEHSRRVLLFPSREKEEMLALEEHIFLKTLPMY
jgi:hypothetical protein